MCVRKVLVKLDCAIEELQCRFVLFLKTVTVAHNTPSLWNKEGLLKRKVTQMGKLMLLLKMPEASGVVLKAFKTIRLNAHHLLVGFHGVLVLGLLEEAASDLSLDPPCFLLFVRKLLVLGLSFCTVVDALQSEGFTNQSEEVH
jgi:hypothetical protein